MIDILSQFGKSNDRRALITQAHCLGLINPEACTVPDLRRAITLAAQVAMMKEIGSAR